MVLSATAHGVWCSLYRVQWALLGESLGKARWFLFYGRFPSRFSHCVPLCVSDSNLTFTSSRFRNDVGWVSGESLRWYT